MVVDELTALRLRCDQLEHRVQALSALVDAARDALRWLEDNAPERFDLAASTQTITIRDDPRPVKAVLEQALARAEEPAA